MIFFILAVFRILSAFHRDLVSSNNKVSGFIMNKNLKENNAKSTFTLNYSGCRLKIKCIKTASLAIMRAERKADPKLLTKRISWSELLRNLDIIGLVSSFSEGLRNLTLFPPPPLLWWILQHLVGLKKSEMFCFSRAFQHLLLSILLRLKNGLT